MKKSIVLLVVIAVIAMSCHSKSGQAISQTPLEKVVVLKVMESFPAGGSSERKMFPIKVKRIEAGVVDVIYEYSQYEVGDTILHRFINR